MRRLKLYLKEHCWEWAANSWIKFRISSISFIYLYGNAIVCFFGLLLLFSCFIIFFLLFFSRSVQYCCCCCWQWRWFSTSAIRLALNCYFVDVVALCHSVCSFSLSNFHFTLLCSVCVCYVCAYIPPRKWKGERKSEIRRTSYSEWSRAFRANWANENQQQGRHNDIIKLYTEWFEWKNWWKD